MIHLYCTTRGLPQGIEFVFTTGVLIFQTLRINDPYAVPTLHMQFARKCIIRSMQNLRIQCSVEIKNPTHTQQVVE